MNDQHSDENGEGEQPGAAITLTVLAISSMTIMANASIAPSLPGMAEAFQGIPNIETLLGLMLSLPSLAIILTAAALGVLAEKLGRKSVLLTSLFVYALGGSSALFVDGMVGLLIGRFVLGVGVAGTMTVATMLAADYWTGNRRSEFMGKQAAVISLGGVVFLIIGGLLSELSWRGAFGIYLLAIPIAFLVWMTLQSDRRQKADDRNLDATLDWGICIKIGSLGFFTMAVFYLIPTRLPFLLAEIGITSSTVSGLSIAAVTLAGVPAALSYQRFAKTFSPLSIYAAGFALMMVGFAVLAASAAVYQIVIGGLFVGLGLGLIMPNQNHWLMDSVRPESRGRAAGILTTFVFAGQFCGPLIAGLINFYTPLRGIFVCFAVALAVVALMLFVVTLKQRQRLPTGIADVIG